MKSKLLFSVIVVILLFVVSCACHRNIPESKQKWVLLWEENFSGNSINPQHWNKVQRGKSDWNNYMANYDELYKVENGSLFLYGTENKDYPNDTAKFITGGLISKNLVSFLYGRVEIRAKLNNASGAWPALWMLPDGKTEWPNGGEIDIMEKLNSDDFVYQTLHSPFTLGKLERKDSPKRYGTNKIKVNDFNTYIVEWYPDSICFFTNDKHTITYPRIPADEANGQFPWKEPFYLILSQQLEGGWVGAVKDPSQLPAVMEIDYIRYYQNKTLRELVKSRNINSKALIK